MINTTPLCFISFICQYTVIHIILHVGFQLNQHYGGLCCVSGLFRSGTSVSEPHTSGGCSTLWSRSQFSWSLGKKKDVSADGKSANGCVLIKFLSCKRITWREQLESQEALDPESSRGLQLCIKLNSSPPNQHQQAEMFADSKFYSLMDAVLQWVEFGMVGAWPPGPKKAATSARRGRSDVLGCYNREWEWP